MGRLRQSNHDLPPRMHLKGGSHYYVTLRDGKRNWQNLGKDRLEALRRWAELEGMESPRITRRFDLIAARYQQLEFPRSSPRPTRLRTGNSQPHGSFRGGLIDAIKPPHLVEYLTHRGKTSTVQANREIAVFSTIFNRAREWGYTTAGNPGEGVRRHRERPRERYVADAEYQAVWEAADWPTRDAMDLALLTGQREADILKNAQRRYPGRRFACEAEQDPRNPRILIMGQLADVVARIQGQGGPYIVAAGSDRRRTAIDRRRAAKAVQAGAKGRRR